MLWQVRVPGPGRSASRNDPGHVVHKHAPLFTKQYKLVPAQAGSQTDTTRDTLARDRVIAASAGVWLRATETEISAALVAREGL